MQRFLAGMLATKNSKAWASLYVLADGLGPTAALVCLLDGESRRPTRS